MIFCDNNYLEYSIPTIQQFKQPSHKAQKIKTYKINKAVVHSKLKLLNFIIVIAIFFNLSKHILDNF